jgi:hypothetical protein
MKTFCTMSRDRWFKTIRYIFGFCSCKFSLPVGFDMSEAFCIFFGACEVNMQSDEI